MVRDSESEVLVKKERLIGMGAWFLCLAIASGVSCRQGEPTGDPKTPANSPLPKLDRKDLDPSSSPGDAG